MKVLRTYPGHEIRIDDFGNEFCTCNEEGNWCAGFDQYQTELDRKAINNKIIGNVKPMDEFIKEAWAYIDSRKHLYD